MDLTQVLDTSTWNTFWAVIIATEGLIALTLRITRPRSSSRTQALVGLAAVAAFGLLQLLTALGTAIQTATGELLPIGSMLPSLALLLRVTIFVLITTFLWHEWKENGVHKREPGGDQ